MEYRPIAVFVPATMRVAATLSVIALGACVVVLAIGWYIHPRNAMFAALTVISIAGAIGCVIALCRVATRLEIDAAGRLRVRFPFRYEDHDLGAARVRLDRDIVTNFNRYRSWDAPRTTLTIDLGDRTLMVLAIEEAAAQLSGFGATVAGTLGEARSGAEPVPIGEIEGVRVLAGAGFRVPAGARILGPLVLIYFGGAAAGLALLMVASNVVWTGFDGPLRDPVASGRSHVDAVSTVRVGTVVLPETTLVREQRGCPYEHTAVRWLWGAESDRAFIVSHTITVPYADGDERAMARRLNEATGRDGIASSALRPWYYLQQWRMSVSPHEATAATTTTDRPKPTLSATVTTPCVRQSDLARFGDDYDLSLRRLVNWLAHG